MIARQLLAELQRLRNSSGTTAQPFESFRFQVSGFEFSAEGASPPHSTCEAGGDPPLADKLNKKASCDFRVESYESREIEPEQNSLQTNTILEDNFSTKGILT